MDFITKELEKIIFCYQNSFTFINTLYKEYCSLQESKGLI